ncbi:hypothetical protein, partial [Rhodopirellula sp. UBA1907]|uniref:hypothetical protein n=1 Tax=Rhodopirellula sp. UBA1907 TaxID=1947381 RepID=UPI00257CCE5A
RTPERRRSISPETSFRERYAMWKSAKKRNQKSSTPSMDPASFDWQNFPVSRAVLCVALRVKYRHYEYSF